MMVRPGYEWWEQALIGVVQEAVIGKPQLGFYKMADGKDKPAKAVAIWMDDGRMVARVNATFFEPADVWERCCRSPITFEDYRDFMAHGAWKNHPTRADGTYTRDLKQADPIY